MCNGFFFAPVRENFERELLINRHPLYKMAVEIQIKHGDESMEKKDFLTALSQYGAAIKENPNAFLAYIKRASAYLKLHDYTNATADISKAFTIAENRGRREDKGLCYYRLGLVSYAEKDFPAALVNFNKAKEFQCTDAALDIWIAKAERDIKKSGGVPKEPQSEKAAAEESVKSTNVDVINKQAPLKPKIRDDWYQSNEEVTVTIYAKNINRDTLSVDFGSRSVAISFPSSDNSEYNYNIDPLFGEIDTAQSSFKVYGTKLEVSLVKAAAGKWASLEATGAPESTGGDEESSEQPLAYPTSSKKAVNWSKFDLKEDDEEQQDFFAKLYKDVDDDTRRAMMKSYVESNGTVLTTNWEEAQSKQFETSPPEGMEAKKWNN